MEEPGGQVIGPHHFPAFLFPGDFPGRFGPFRHRDPIFFRQLLQSFREGQVVPLHHVREHIPSGPAAEAVEQPPGRIHLEGRRFLPMKGTASPVLGAPALQAHRFRNDGQQISSLPHLLFEIGHFLFQFIHGILPFSLLRYCFYSTKKRKSLLAQKFPLDKIRFQDS